MTVAKSVCFQSVYVDSIGKYVSVNAGIHRNNYDPGRPKMLMYSITMIIKLGGKRSCSCIIILKE